MTIELNKYNHCKEKSHACNEKRKRFEIIATPDERLELWRIKVDGCIYNKTLNDIKYCDYIFIYKDIFACFVELKGKDISHAVKQLEDSIKNIPTDEQKYKYAFIVPSKVDNPNYAKQIEWKRMFKTKHNTSFEIKSTKMTKFIKELQKS